jgi:cytochrome c biogenesis protein CcmG/thiol:disulfide interchange protein DsbE
VRHYASDSERAACQYYRNVLRTVRFLALATLAATLALTAGCDRGNHPSQIGAPAPDFSIADGARSLRLDQYRGKVVVLNFWASWCAPCIEELPSLTALQKQMPGIQVLAVSTDQDPAAYRQFLSDNPIHLLTINDPGQHSSNLYGSFRWPETYVIDPKGVIRRKFIGAQDWTSPEIVEYLHKLQAGV